MIEQDLEAEIQHIFIKLWTQQYVYMLHLRILLRTKTSDE